MGADPATLPARVRVTRPPLPLAPALEKAASKLLPEADLAQAQAAALAIAGGSVIGAALDSGQAVQMAVAAGWRGKGIEAALQAALTSASENEADDRDA